MDSSNEISSSQNDNVNNVDNANTANTNIQVSISINPDNLDYQDIRSYTVKEWTKNSTSTYNCINNFTYVKDLTSEYHQLFKYELKSIVRYYVVQTIKIDDDSSNKFCTYGYQSNINGEYLCSDIELNNYSDIINYGFDINQTHKATIFDLCHAVYYFWSLDTNNVKKEFIRNQLNINLITYIMYKLSIITNPMQSITDQNLWIKNPYGYQNLIFNHETIV